MTPPASATGDAFALSIADPTLLALYRHWLQARGTRAMPGRKQIDPMAIQATLPNLFLYDYDAAAQDGAGRFYCRLAGEQINAMVGTVCSKRYLDQIFQSPVLEVVHQRYREVVTTPTVFFMHGVVRMANGLSVPGERVILPLASDGATGDGLVGASVYHLPRPGQPTAAWLREDFLDSVAPGLPPAGWAYP